MEHLHRSRCAISLLLLLEIKFRHTPSAITLYVHIYPPVPYILQGKAFALRAVCSRCSRVTWLYRRYALLVGWPMQNDWERLGYHVVVGKDYNEVNLKLHTKTCKEHPVTQRSDGIICIIQQNLHWKSRHELTRGLNPSTKATHLFIQGAVARCCKKTYGW